ncbi:conserved hypothetical protein [Trichinella spiralis]|uniref:hypothetical protein n=1 Tax=Trichinella spiralis TaxID=6334 RepID=UPI0001EFC14F|nr:conserved hypothetical protein [Trichinella spiralis]
MYLRVRLTTAERIGGKPDDVSSIRPAWPKGGTNLGGAKPDLMLSFNVRLAKSQLPDALSVQNKMWSSAVTQLWRMFEAT